MDERTIQRVKRGLSDPVVGPETLALMLTRVCNFNCVYCRGNRCPESREVASAFRDELTTEELFVLFDDARTYGVSEVNLGGMNGEPFCKKDIVKIMRRIKELGFCGSMTTNGSFLNASFANEMSDLGWDILLLSLDSPDENVQYALRPSLEGKPYFGGVIDFLETCEAVESRLRILINMVITKLNYRDLPKMAAFAGRYKTIKSINLLRVVDMGLPNHEDLRLGDKELEEFRTMLFQLEDKGKITYTGDWGIVEGSCALKEGKAGLSCTPDTNNRCFANYYILSVDANGDVLHCPQQHRVVGGLNVKKVPLRRLWTQEHLEFRRGLAMGAPCFQECCTILKEQNRAIARQVV
ncbi:MAG: radical SAM protein [Candidatus Omnitrophota bacterium]